MKRYEFMCMFQNFMGGVAVESDGNEKDALIKLMEFLKTDARYSVMELLSVHCLKVKFDIPFSEAKTVNVLYEQGVFSDSIQKGGSAYDEEIVG